MAQNKLLYTFGKTILFPAYKLLYRFKVKNKGAVPPEGGVILASNHMSFADPVLLGLSEKRRLYFMAKQELFRNKFAGAVIRALGAFPVERGAGDGRAIKNGEDILREGNVIVRCWRSKCSCRSCRAASPKRTFFTSFPKRSFTSAMCSHRSSSDSRPTAADAS